MVRLPKNHELRGCLERAAVRGARRMGVSPCGHGTPLSRRIEASLPLAVSLADGAALPHSSHRHRTRLGVVVLRFALRAGKTRAWHTLFANRAWGLSARTVFESPSSSEVLLCSLVPLPPG